MRIASRLGLLLVATVAASQTPTVQTPPTAGEVLAAAKTQAAGQRAIFAMFHASW